MSRTELVVKLVSMLVAIFGAYVLGASRCYASEQEAERAAIADNASTLAALAAGAAEANPIGLASLALKLPVMAYARTLPDAEREELYRLAAPVWSGAAANNLCVLAVLLSGGTAAPGCLLVGLAWGLHASNVRVEPVAVDDMGAEVAFWQACHEYKQSSGDVVRCVYRMEE